MTLYCKRIHSLLGGASCLARRCPALQMLILWDGGRGHAFAFKFEARGGNAFHHLTWNMAPGLGHVSGPQSGQRMKERLWHPDHCGTCGANYFETIEDDIRTHVDAIHCVKLPVQVVNPRSLCQMGRDPGAISMRASTQVNACVYLSMSRYQEHRK
jgi:hypothetical protein